MVVFVLGLAALSAVIGYWAGTRQAAMTEGDAILAYAQVYALETGGAITDCHGEPLGEGWLTVVCRGSAGSFRYDVGAGGVLLGTRHGEAGA